MVSTTRELIWFVNNTEDQENILFPLPGTRSCITKPVEFCVNGQQEEPGNDVGLRILQKSFATPPVNVYILFEQVIYFQFQPPGFFLIQVLGEVRIDHIYLPVKTCSVPPVAIVFPLYA